MQLRVLGNPVASFASQPANSAFDPDCFDFTAYLSRRLGVDTALTAELLGQWLKPNKRSDQRRTGTEA
jgi:hypothetical protein